MHDHGRRSVNANGQIAILGSPTTASFTAAGPVAPYGIPIPRQLHLPLASTMPETRRAITSTTPPPTPTSTRAGPSIRSTGRQTPAPTILPAAGPTSIRSTAKARPSGSTTLLPANRPPSRTARTGPTRFPAGRSHPRRPSTSRVRSSLNSRPPKRPPSYTSIARDRQSVSGPTLRTTPSVSATKAGPLAAPSSTT